MHHTLLRQLSLVAACSLACIAPGLAWAQAKPGSTVPSASAMAATLTILDGGASLLRGEQRLQLAEGVRLVPLDIVETGKDNRLLRIEFADGLALSLGPETRLLIDPRFVGERGRAARVYLLRGWVKLNQLAPATPPAAGNAPALLASPAFDIRLASGSAVASVQPGAARVFVETGELALQERDVDNAVGTLQTLRAGAYFARVGAAKSAVSARPAPDFVQALPRGFLDSLPARADKFKDRPVEAKPQGEPTYADLQDWLRAESSLRRGLMPRWTPLLRKPLLRSAAAANMASHPEWDRVLFPEKYLPKPGYPASAASPSR
jgi:hypothetical protein